MVSNGQFTPRLQHIEAGTYQMRITGNTAQQVFAQRITHSGGGSVQTIQLPANLDKGIYRIIINGNDELYTNIILLQ